MVVSKKKVWKLTPEQLVTRREQLGRELDEVAKKRDELRSTGLRLAEVKELIKATELGQEQEELKASAKDLELILEGLHKNVERLSREVLTEETEEPQDTLPGVDAMKGKGRVRPPKASAAERTLALPETGEPAPLALPPGPGPRHPDAIEGEVVTDEQIEAEEEARAAHNLRESWRTMALVIVENHGAAGISGPDLHEIVCAVCADQPLAAPSSEELLDLLVTMIKSGALTRDAQGWYVCPPKAPSDANVQRAALRVLQVEKGWCTQAVLVRLVQEEFPIGVCPPESQILDCLRALQKGGRVEWDGDDGVPCWKLIPEAPKASKKAPKVKTLEARPKKGKGIAEASQAAYEAEGEALGKALEEEDFDTTLFRPSKHPEHLLPTLTSKGKNRVLALLRETPGGRMSVEEIRRRLRLPIVPLPSECFYQSGDWVLKEEAPKKPARGRKAAH